MANANPFWEKPLDELNQDEWEKLCDGCGRCCLHKLEDEDTGRIYYTQVGCALLDEKTCQCGDYPNRQKLMPDCTRLSRDDVEEFKWLPETCAYRLRAENKPLYPWHPLLTGDKKALHRAGISVQGWVIKEQDVDMDALQEFIIEDEFLKP